MCCSSIFSSVAERIDVCRFLLVISAPSKYLFIYSSSFLGSVKSGNKPVLTAF